jgi:hypothetical protein
MYSSSSSSSSSDSDEEMFAAYMAMKEFRPSSSWSSSSSSTDRKSTGQVSCHGALHFKGTGICKYIYMSKSTGQVSCHGALHFKGTGICKYIYMRLGEFRSSRGLVWKCLLRCHIKLQLELLSAQRNSLLLALPNHCWIHGIRDPSI